MNPILLIGASHALYMAQCFGEVDADLDRVSAGPVPVRSPDPEAAISLLLLSRRTAFVAFEPGPQGLSVRANAALLEAVRRYDRPDARVALLINGNEHNSQFMLASPVPFDFEHPRVPGLLPGRQPVPARFVRKRIEASLALTRLTVAFLAGQLPRAQRFFVAPPPPIPSEAHIRAHPEGFDFAGRAIEHPRVRLKVYEAYLDALADLCAASGVTLLRTPARQRDAEGFLVEPMWYGCTHARPESYAPVYAELGVRLEPTEAVAEAALEA